MTLREPPFKGERPGLCGLRREGEDRCAYPATTVRDVIDALDPTEGYVRVPMCSLHADFIDSHPNP